MWVQATTFFYGSVVKRRLSSEKGLATWDRPSFSSGTVWPFRLQLPSLSSSESQQSLSQPPSLPSRLAQPSVCTDVASSLKASLNMPAHNCPSPPSSSLSRLSLHLFRCLTLPHSLSLSLSLSIHAFVCFQGIRKNFVIKPQWVFTRIILHYGLSGDSLSQQWWALVGTQVAYPPVACTLDSNSGDRPVTCVTTFSPPFVFRS